jgi:hypothetical protein
MAVALYVTGISTSEVHPESPPLLGTLTKDATFEVYPMSTSECPDHGGKIIVTANLDADEILNP